MLKLNSNNSTNKNSLSSSSIPQVDENLRLAIETVKGVTINSINDIINLSGDLDLSNISLTSLDGLEFAQNIGQLYLNNTQISDISKLANLTQLTWLELTDSKIESIDSITNLINLIGLKIDNNPLKTPSSLSKLSKLKVLRMRNVFTELTPIILSAFKLPTLSNIKVLDLSQNGISSLVDNLGNSFIPNPDNLLALGLEKNNISSIDVLRNLKQIRYLYIDANQISDITPLNNKTSLYVLYLGSNNLKDLGTIPTLTNLHELQLNNLGISDLSFLQTNLSLERLSLKINYIKDLSPLISLQSLILLNLDFNKIRTIVPLKSIPSLAKVTMDNNYIANLCPLYNSQVILPPYNTITAINQKVILSKPPIINNTLTLDLTNLLCDIDKSVPKYFKNLSSNEMTIQENIITYSGVSPEDKLSFQFSNGSYTERTATGIYFTGDVLLANVITFPDSNLEKKLLEILRKETNDPVTDEDLKYLVNVDLSYSEIKDLSGLEHAENLETINLNNNNIADFSPILELSKLNEVTAINQIVEYPLQTIPPNDKVDVSLDLLSSKRDDYLISLIKISNNGFTDNTRVFWHNLIGTPILTFNYSVTYPANNPAFINITATGQAIVRTQRTEVTRGINLFI